MSRRHLLKRQKGYKDINVVLLDIAPPRRPTTGSQSSTCRRSDNNVLGVGESSLDTEDHGCVIPAMNVLADLRSNYRKTSTMQHKHQIILPCLLTSETNGPRKLPVGLISNSDTTTTTTSVPGATWQKTPLISYSYMGHHPKVKSTTGKSSSRHTSYDRMDPTHPSRGRTESNSRLRMMMKEESFCSSNLGSDNRSSLKTRCNVSLKSQGRLTTIQQQQKQHSHRHCKEGWYKAYLYNPYEDQDKYINVEDGDDEIHKYQCSIPFLEEPDYYCYDEDVTPYDPVPTDQLSSELPDALLDESCTSHSPATTAIITDSSLGLSSSDETTMVNIGDGTMLRLRGADETWRAVENDYYTPSVCICCETTLFCISDADYFICPGCRVISPLNNNRLYNHDDQMVLSQSGGVGSSTSVGGGVGLGFTLDELSSWQQEMI